MRLRALLLEDNPHDAELVLAELRRAGFAVEWELVHTERSYLEKLSPELDVIISDYSMPGFDAPRALRLLQESGLEIPFIIVSGNVGEDTAVDAMRAGAADYLLKDRLARLGIAVARALEVRASVIERQRSSQKLELLGTAMEQAGEAVTITDRRGVVEYVNPAFEEITGFSRSEAEGSRLIDLNGWPPDSELLREALRAISAGEVWKGRVTSRRKDGSLYEADLIASPVRHASGRIVHYVAISRDVSEQLELERALQHAQKMEAVGLLAGGVAHDFNNLLTAIQGYSELVLLQHGDDPKLRADVEEILRAAGQATGLTRQLLAFSRKQHLTPRVLDLVEVVRDAERLLRRVIGEDVEIALELAPDTPAVLADRGQLEQVLMNLAVNARDAMPGGGRLTFTCGSVEVDEEMAARHAGLQPGRYSSLVVQDTGEGMDAETLSRIFEPFFTTKAPGKGTGLGMSTVFGIVKQSGGYIGVKSTPREGSTFTVLLPTAAGHGRQVEPAEAADDRIASTVPSATVLVVEDEEATLLLVRRLLEREGHQVLTASDYAEALGHCQEHGAGIDLLLTDVVLAGISGPQLAATLRLSYPQLRVIFMSGYSGDALGRELDEGALLLQKPFSMNALGEIVQRALADRDR